MDSDPHRQTDILILPTDPAYIDQLVDLQRRGYNVTPADYDHPELIQAHKFQNHLDVFPEGQFMAYDPQADRVVGACVSQIVDIDITQPVMHSWAETTDFGSISTHNPNGEWLYGVDNVVLREYRGMGIGGRLMRARYSVARKYNLRGMIAGSMPIDFHRAYAQDGVDIKTYVAQVISGQRWDTNLSKQLKKGCRVLNVIPNYLNDAPRTRNYGVAIVWDNPDYRPVRVPAVAKRLTAAQRQTTNQQPGAAQP